MAISAAQRVQAAYAAGFRNSNSVEALSIIVAISLAECGVGSGSGCEQGFCCGGAAGVWQIQLDAHPDVSRACAEDVNCCARAAWSISGGGVNFTPWTTYGYYYPSFVGWGNGVFREYLTQARQAISSLPAPIGPGSAPAPPPAPIPTPVPVAPPPPPSPTSFRLSLIVGSLVVGAAIWGARHEGYEITGDTFGGSQLTHTAGSPRTEAAAGTFGVRGS